MDNLIYNKSVMTVKPQKLVKVKVISGFMVLVDGNVTIEVVGKILEFADRGNQWLYPIPMWIKSDDSGQNYCKHFMKIPSYHAELFYE